MTESLLLATVSSAAGLAIAQGAVLALKRFGPQELPRLQAVHLDGTVLFFTLAITLLTGLLFGLAPAVQAGKPSLNGLLKEGGRTGTAGRQGRLRNALVAAEVALALVLVVGTGLLVRSFWKLQQTDTGFNPEHVLTATVSLPQVGYTDGTNIVRFEQRLLERVATLPGVQSAGLTSDLPWTGYDENAGFDIEGKTFPSGDGPGGRYHFVSADYFRTVGVPLVAGRFFNSSDRQDSPKVLLINRSLAERYWPGESPVGQRITFTSNPKEKDWRIIVGVVGDVKDSPDSSTTVPAFYFSTAQSPIRQTMLAVRTTAAPAATIASVREELHHLDGNVPIAEVKPLEVISEAAVAGRRFTFWLVGCFAATALTLAAIGIYGVLSYLVAQRTREIGVRMALGAQASDIIRLTLKQGMRPTIIGVVLGLAGAFALTQLMSSLLFDVSATDPGTFIASTLLLILVALLPCWLPARRASKIDPMEALRTE